MKLYDIGLFVHALSYIFIILNRIEFVVLTCIYSFYAGVNYLNCYLVYIGTLNYNLLFEYFSDDASFKAKLVEGLLCHMCMLLYNVYVNK